MVSGAIRIGVIGVGFGAKVQIPAFISEGFEVTAVCSRQKERAENAAQNLNIPNAYTDYRKMLEQNDLNAVSIVAPPNLHHEITIAALDAGKHVLCEKPFAMNQTEAKEMLEKGVETGLTTMVAHEFRFAPARAYVKALLEEGYIGDLQNASMSMFMRGGPPGGRGPGLDWRQFYEYGGGQLGGLGSHYIDCLRDWFGEIKSITGGVFENGDLVSNSEDKADDAFGVLALFNGGGWASIAANFSAPLGSRVRIEINGSKGSLSTPHHGVNPPLDGIVLGAQFEKSDELNKLEIPGNFLLPSDDRDARIPMFRVLARKFREGIENGTSPHPNFVDGYQGQKIIDSIKEIESNARWSDIGS